MVTHEHPFHTRDGRWVPAGELKIGDEVMTRDGSWLALQQVVDIPDNVSTHNFMVADDHNYFVGRSELWVHNCCRLFKTGLRGKSLNWINKQKPSNWKRVASDNGRGFKWLDENGTERFRFQRPNGRSPSGSQWSRESNGYMRWQNERGEFLDIDGNVVPRTHPEFNELTHIPYEGI